ncbi:polysaccharide deacetylase family protein [Halosimplex amylolyticum]|uniref:polysaccharide deacetylase family protein n=1 Tax=Halosimplex amylolyticum TaxID=3396616 RepID=UPI003F554613
MAVHPSPASGCLVISLDTELAWGYHGFGGGDHLSTDGRRERRNVSRLVETFERHDAPATWAIVGHLMLTECDGEHKDLPKPSYPEVREWYRNDPGSSADEQPLRYAPDILSTITGSGVEHELGLHTFSHVLCDRAGCPPAVLRAEIERCSELAEEFGFDPETLVFPRNGAAHIEVLADMGISIYRGKSADAVLRREPFGRYREYLRFLLRTTPPVVEPTQTPEGVWNLPASQSLIYDPLDEINELFPTHPRVRRAEKGIARAKRENKIFHIWSHPHNYDEQMFRDLERILSFAASEGVPVLTMAEAVNRFGNRS